MLAELRDVPCPTCRAVARRPCRTLDGQSHPARIERGDYWELFGLFMTQTGVRVGEAIELRWGRDVDFGLRPRIRLRWQFADGAAREPKSRYGKRDIPLSPGLAGRLAERQRQPGDLVFTTTRGTRLSRHNLYRDVLGPAARRAGLTWVTLHTFRRTCASLLFASPIRGGGGKNIKQVQEWLGHHSPAFTLETYVHLMDEGLATRCSSIEVPLGS